MELTPMGKFWRQRGSHFRTVAVVVKETAGFLSVIG